MWAEQDVSAGQAEHLFPDAFLAIGDNLHVLADQPADEQHCFFLADIGEKPVVTDLHEALRQYMQQKSPDELHGRQYHDLGEVVVVPVLVGEGYPMVVDGLYSMIRDGNPVGIAAQIGQNLFRPAEGLLCINNPLFLPGLLQKRGAPDRQRENLTFFLQHAQVAFFQLPGKRDDMEEEVVPAFFPVMAVEGEHSSWNKAMNMKMVYQALAPGMQDSQQTWLALQPPLWIGSKGENCVPHRGEQVGQ